jgi:hypothetical protein
MANLIVNQGIGFDLDRLAAINGPPAAVQSMAVDDGNPFTATDTKLNDQAATQVAAVGMDASFPSRAASVLSFQGTFATGVGNFTIKRISLHNIASGSVTLSSTTLYGGVDTQSITKTSAFSLTVKINVTGASA